MTPNEKTSADFPVLSGEQIKAGLKTTNIGKEILIFDSLESTNDTAKKRVQTNLIHGEVLFAIDQTAGKGRLGRQWSSSKGKAISMSLILSPFKSFEKPYLITQLTAAALSNALSNTLDTHIKWPNDLLIHGKKVAGILTETLYSGSTLEAIIIGIGINANQEETDFPQYIFHKASSLRVQNQSSVDPNPIISSFLNEFERMYEEYEQTNDPSPFLSICRKRSAIIGKTVWILRGDEKKKATVQTIGHDGELRVIYEENEQQDALYGGEVSIRGLDGYV